MTTENLKQVYTQIKNDEYILNLYDEVNRKINYVIDHGMLHINAVLNYINKICEVIECSENIRYLSLIACLLHDVGRLEDRKTHHEKSAVFAKTYLQNKLERQDIEIVADAITQHEKTSFDYSTKNDVAWILIMADKMDYTRSRYIPELLEEEHKSKYSYNIEKIELKRENDKVKVEITLFNPDKNFELSFKTNLNIYKKALEHFSFKDIEIKIDCIDLNKNLS